MSLRPSKRQLKSRSYFSDKIKLNTTSKCALLAIWPILSSFSTIQAASTYSEICNDTLSWWKELSTAHTHSCSKEDSHPLSGLYSVFAQAPLGHFLSFESLLSSLGTWKTANTVMLLHPANIFANKLRTQIAWLWICIEMTRLLNGQVCSEFVQLSATRLRRVWEKFPASRLGWFCGAIHLNPKRKTTLS